jgi:predicted ATPase
MMLAQTVQNDNAMWAGVSALCLLFLTQFAGVAKDWMKDRRVREESFRRDEYLKDIAATNREAMKSLHDVSNNQIAAREEIKGALGVAAVRHEQVIKAIENIPCHFKTEHE